MKQHTLGPFEWLEVDEPRTGDLDRLRQQFGLPSFALDVALRAHHRPRLERYDGHLLVVLKPASYVDPDEVVEVGQLIVLVGPQIVVTIGAGHQGLLRRIRRGLQVEPERLTLGPMSVVHAIVDEVVDGYAVVLDGLDTDVDEIEMQVFAGGRGSYAERIYRLKSEVQEFRRAAVPLVGELDGLVASGSASGVEALADEFGEVRAKAVRVAEHVGHLDELLNSALNAHLAQIAVQQNNDMRRISAWVAIVAAPTAMASIYGMNFRFMPELEWRYGYFVVLSVMASVCGVLYRLFRRSGWL